MSYSIIAEIDNGEIYEDNICTTVIVKTFEHEEDAQKYMDYYENQSEFICDSSEEYYNICRYRRQDLLSNIYVAYDKYNNIISDGFIINFRIEENGSKIKIGKGPKKFLVTKTLYFYEYNGNKTNNNWLEELQDNYIFWFFKHIMVYEKTVDSKEEALEIVNNTFNSDAFKFEYKYNEITLKRYSNEFYELNRMEFENKFTKEFCAKNIYLIQSIRPIFDDDIVLNNDKNIKIWVDDIREAPDGYYHLFSTNDAIQFIQMNWDNIEEISLDHDSGDFFNDGGDYKKILDWIEFVSKFNNKEVPFMFNIHSMNPVGVQNMRAIIQRNNWIERE